MAGSQHGVELSRRYAKADLRIFTEEEARRLVGDGHHSSQDDIPLLRTGK
jgi:hypothetical protein